MSRCLNRATLIGYLGADPDVRTTTSGSRVAQLSLATTRRWNDGKGHTQEKTQWHRIVVWDSLPGMFAFVEKYLRKGDRVYVEGEIDYRSYEDGGGNARWVTEIQRGEIEDYYLFPAGRLKRGKALVDRCIHQPLGPTAIRVMFRALEKAAGVEHQQGRSFYGLRRQATDLAPEFAQDARVLNRLTGHLDSATRERVYQDPQNELVRARAAKARRQMRDYLAGKGEVA